MALSVLAAVAPLTPGTPSLHAQVSPEILQVLQQGGAWVTLPIEGGVGSFQSGPVPTLGIHLRGHLQIWEEHTGSWHVVMRDLAKDADLVILERLMVPGERVDFDYQTGMLGQIQIDVQWSEARDTTLRVWVGTELTPREKADSGADRITSSGAGTRNSYLMTSADVYRDYAGNGICARSAQSAGPAAGAENRGRPRLGPAPSNPKAADAAAISRTSWWWRSWAA